MKVIYALTLYRNYGAGRGMSLEEFFLWCSLPLFFVFISVLYFWMERNEYHFSKILKYWQNLHSEAIHILSQNFSFYQNLSEAEKKRFENRVHHFLVNKIFESPNGDAIPEERMILIAAASVQIGFGLEPIYLSHFRKIVISENDKIELKEIEKRKTIFISWRAFEEGYSCASDGYNPGLQSIAVAMSIEHRLWGGHYGILGHRPFRMWRDKSRRAAAALVSTGLSRFKSMREINEDEYFASAVVYFFEQPQSFKEKFPELYKAMKYLLNQDPIKKNGSKY